MKNFGKPFVHFHLLCNRGNRNDYYQNEHTECKLHLWVVKSGDKSYQASVGTRVRKSIIHYNCKLHLCLIRNIFLSILCNANRKWYHKITQIWSCIFLFVNLKKTDFQGALRNFLSEKKAVNQISLGTSNSTFIFNFDQKFFISWMES